MLDRAAHRPRSSPDHEEVHRDRRTSRTQPSWSTPPSNSRVHRQVPSTSASPSTCSQRHTVADPRPVQFLNGSLSPRIAHASELVRTSADVLARAERPLLLLGWGAAIDGAAADGIGALSENLGAPVVTSTKAEGASRRAPTLLGHLGPASGQTRSLRSAITIPTSC